MSKPLSFLGLSALLLACKPTAPSSQQPPVVDKRPSLVFFPISHLDTNVSGSSTNVYVQNMDVDDPAVVFEQTAETVSISSAAGGSVAASVERITDHNGDGLHISWPGGLASGWYKIQLLPKYLPEVRNPAVWSVDADKASLWFRVGSQPLVTAVSRCKQAERSYFEIKFSERVRAETSDTAGLVEVLANGERVSCHAVKLVGSEELMQFNQLLSTLVLSCNGDTTSSNKMILSSLKSPDGAPVLRADGSAVSLEIDWASATPVGKERLCEAWYETKLPLGQ